MVISKVGDGTLYSLSFSTPGHIMLPTERFPLTTAEEAGNKYQYYCAVGGTDAERLTCRMLVSHQQLSVFVPVDIHSHQTLYAMMTS